VSITRRFAVRFIETYQRDVSPSLGARCLFEPSCSEYGRQAFQRHGTLRAARLTIGRLRRCRPDHAGPFVDPVPG
jgi:uncharacterized protein